MIFRNLIFLLLPFFISAQTDINPTEIVKKADQKMRGETSYSEITMQIVRPDWERQISMRIWLKGQDYLMIYITDPAREKGTTYLKRKSQIWNWLPDVERMVKLPPSMMMQSWMGSDFTHNDLVRQSSIVTDYEHKLAGTEIIRGFETYKLRMLPKEEAPVVWSEVLGWITKSDYLQLRTEFYGDDGELEQTLTFSEINMMDGREIPTRLEMIPANTEGKKTIIIYEKIDFNREIPDSFFSIQNMKEIR